MTTTPARQGQLPILTIIIIFILGFISGVGFSAFKLSPEGSGNVANQQDEAHSTETAKAIANLEAEVTGDPENFNAWVQLGHLYFDTNQHEKAISAYTTSLKYHSGDANLLTDLGIMYRKMDQPEKAIEWFKKAQAMDPQHQQSRYNEGIVRYYDLGDIEGAIASWEEVLKINPDVAAGDSKLRDFVDHIKAEQSSKK